jgi:hypothetical protein
MSFQQSLPLTVWIATHFESYLPPNLKLCRVARMTTLGPGCVQRRQKQIEERVGRYISQLDTADRQTAAGEDPSETVLLTKTRLKEKLAKLEEEVKRLAAIEKALLARSASFLIFGRNFRATTRRTLFKD